MYLCKQEVHDILEELNWYIELMDSDLYCMLMERWPYPWQDRLLRRIRDNPSLDCLLSMRKASLNRLQELMPVD